MSFLLRARFMDFFQDAIRFFLFSPSRLFARLLLLFDEETLTLLNPRDLLTWMTLSKAWINSALAFFWKLDSSAFVSRWVCCKVCSMVMVLKPLEYEVSTRLLQLCLDDETETADGIPRLLRWRTIRHNDDREMDDMIVVCKWWYYLSCCDMIGGGCSDWERWGWMCALCALCLLGLAILSAIQPTNSHADMDKLSKVNEILLETDREQQRKPQWCDYHKFTIPPPHLKYCTKHHNNISHHLHYCSWNDSDKNNAESEKMSCCVRYTYDVQEHKTISHSLSFTNKMSQPLYVKTYGTQTQTHTCST